MSTQLTDTIIANQEVIEAIRNNSAYAYEKQVVPNKKSFIDHILNAIGDLLDSLIPDMSPKDPENNMLWIVITLGVILVVILLVAHFKFNLFKFARKTKVEKDYEVELEDINTIETHNKEKSQKRREEIGATKSQITNTEEKFKEITEVKKNIIKLLSMT